MKVWEMLSKAFLKSMRRMRADCFLEMVLFMRFIMLRMQLPIFFSDVYAFCSLPMMWESAGLILLVMHALASL